MAGWLAWATSTGLHRRRWFVGQPVLAAVLRESSATRPTDRLTSPGIDTSRAWPTVARSALLGGDSHVIVQELRREIGAIRPHESVKFGVNREPLEERLVTQCFEYQAPQGWPEVDFARGSIAKPKPHDVPTD